MAKNTETLAVKLPADTAKAIRDAERATGANRSELAREAITLGLRPAVTRLLESAKRNRELLAIPAK